MLPRQLRKTTVTEAVLFYVGIVERTSSGTGLLVGNKDRVCDDRRIMFGEVPYRRTWYSEAANERAEMHPIIDLLSQFKSGLFEEFELLSSYLSSPSKDVRQYALQLFTDVCPNRAVHSIESSLNAADSMDEVRAVMIRLGETLSLEAIPILLSWSRKLEDSEMLEYIGQSLRTILPLSDIDESSIPNPETECRCDAAVSTLDRSLYYYRGEPVFVGNVTKELIQACTVAYGERGRCILTMQPQILSNFSGIECPIVHGQQISDNDMTKVFSYVKTIAGMKWQVGVKYFFHHEVEK